MKSRREIERMTKDEIKEYAKKEHGISLSTNDLKRDMVDQLLSERKADKSDGGSSSTRSFIITVAVLVGLFLAIMGGVKLVNESKSKPYNGFPFEKQGILWVTQAQKGDQPYRIPFYHHPSELEDIVVQRGVGNELITASRERPNTTVFITVDPDFESNAVVAAVEISRLTGERYNILNLETHGALTREPENVTASAQNPVVTCADDTESTIVIHLKPGPQNVVHKQDGCIILEATDSEDMLRVADRFAYDLLGVMK